jgi:DNA-binding HxlR family transcriptional regulator
MRSYGQYCSVAKALDVIGERWNLLIVRELLLRGACRYTDLLNGLPGIATNLLADRLRELEHAGIVVREDAPPPIAATLFRLTPRGEQLEGVLVELGRWGVPYMVEPTGDEVFSSRWLAFPAELFLRDTEPDAPPVRIELRTGEEEPMTVEAAGGEVHARPGATADPDLILSSATPYLLLGVLSGRLPLTDARKRGLRHDGDVEVLRRLRPDAPADAAGGQGAAAVAGNISYPAAVRVPSG